MKIQQRGFSAIEAVIIVAVVVLVGIGGWLVLNAQKKHDKPQQTTNANNDNKQASLKEYVNADYGFSFKYPDDWALKEDLKDEGRGGKEGEVSVTAPAGTKVYFSPHREAKGDSCKPDPSDRPDHTKNCATLRILSTEKTNASNEAKPVYSTKRQLTEPIERGGNPMFFIALTTTDESLKVNTPFTDYGGDVYQDIYIEGKGYVKAYITHKGNKAGFSYGTTKDYFDTTEVTEGLPILESFRLL